MKTKENIESDNLGLVMKTEPSVSLTHNFENLWQNTINSNQIGIPNTNGENNESIEKGTRFQCPECDSSFAQKHNLSMHMKRMHSDEVDR